MKVLPRLLLGIVVLGALSSFVMLLNAGAALDDARSEVTRLRQRSDISLSVLRKDWLGRDASSLAELSKNFERQEVVVKSRDGATEIGQLVFLTKSGVIVDVRYVD